MTLHAHPLATQRIADVVRFDAVTAHVFADLGIGPRYTSWTVAAAARAEGVNIDRLVRSLIAALGRKRAPGNDPAALLTGSG